MDQILQSVFEDNTVHSMLEELYGYSEETFDHSVRMACYIHTLYNSLRLPQFMEKEILEGTLLHDIGKLEIPTSILHKPGSLNDKEREIINLHTSFGQQRLHGFPKAVQNIAALHHKKDEDVPDYVKAVSALDIYDALSHKRCYKSKTSNDMIENIMDEEVKRGTLLKDHVCTILSQMDLYGTLDVFLPEEVFDRHKSLYEITLDTPKSLFEKIMDGDYNFIKEPIACMELQR